MSENSDSEAVKGMELDYIGFVYGLFVATGGFIGYAKAGSLMSLFSGLGFGALICLGAWQISSNSNHFVMLVASGILSLVMGVRFYSSHKLMPAGFVCIMSLVILARSVIKGFI